jgi:hypothetical protein
MQLEQGKTYRVRLTSGAWVDAQFLSAEDYGGIKTYSPDRRPITIRKRTRYHFRNIRTGRTITLRSQRKVKQIEGGAL